MPGDKFLRDLRAIANLVLGDRTWQWIGPHMSQRMFAITEAHAKNNVARYGGFAQKMPDPTMASESDMTEANAAAAAEYIIAHTVPHGERTTEFWNDAKKAWGPRREATMFTWMERYESSVPLLPPEGEWWVRKVSIG
jgi:hypothetical protein